MNESLKRFLNSAVVFMTGVEGQELAQAGLIVVAQPTQQDPSNPGAVRVLLTEAGQAQLNAMSAPAPAAAPAPAPAPAPAAAPAFPSTPVAAAPLTQVPVVEEIATTQPAVAATTPLFAVASGVSIPKTKRRGNPNLGQHRRSSKYPFDQLAEPTFDANGNLIAASFHVPATTEEPTPWKSLASTVTAANKRSEIAAIPAAKETVEKQRRVKGADGKAIKNAEGKFVLEKYNVEQDVMVQTKRFVCREVDSTDPAGAGVRVFRVPLDFKG